MSFEEFEEEAKLNQGMSKKTRVHGRLMNEGYVLFFRNLKELQNAICPIAQWANVPVSHS